MKLKQNSHRLNSTVFAGYRLKIKMNFLDKIVLVSGASSGIGAAIALKFASNGADLVIVGRNESKLKSVNEKIQNMGRRALTMIADVTKEDDLKKIVKGTIYNYRKLDVLVNNAGTLGFQSILSEGALQAFDKVMATNLRSAVSMTHLVAKHLIKTKGNIINISSIGSLGVLHPMNFSYCTSKAGLDHFTRCIAMELSSYGVRVNSVNPGPVRTDFMDTLGINKEDQEKMIEDLAKCSLLGKVADPKEIADVVLFLASDLAKSVTGSSYVIDNGVLLRGYIDI